MSFFIIVLIMQFIYFFNWNFIFPPNILFLSLFTVVVRTVLWHCASSAAISQDGAIYFPSVGRPRCSFSPVVARNSEVATGFAFRPGRIFVIVVVHIQCFELFKSMKCAVLSILLCTIKNPWIHPIRVRHSPDFGLFSVAILPWFSKRKRCKAIFTHSL